MARKAIVISNASGQDPINRLLRELNIIRSNPHPNIISLYGAYTMNSYAPSYGTEVGLLLEYCPGRSLAAIAERMADRDGWVEEAVVGRLAEGVSSSSSNRSRQLIQSEGSAGSCVSCLERSRARRYSTIQLIAVQRRRH
jgi:serine/threonine protein kinase